MDKTTPLSRILYIEDDADIRTIADIALAHLGGMELMCCANGAEGLKAIDQFKPQLILLDVMMPNMDGPTVLAKIRQQPRHQQIPIVFITAKVQASELKYLTDLGALSVITKPFNPIELCEQLKQLWRSYVDD